jgi:hypothetical protein
MELRTRAYSSCASAPTIEAQALTWKSDQASLSLGRPALDFPPWLSETLPLQPWVPTLPYGQRA